MNWTAQFFARERVRNVMASILPDRAAAIKSLRVFAMILGGGIILAPLLYRMPILGFDWYFFFNSGSRVHNLNSSLSFYPPFANLILPLLTWMPWRQSLAILGGITLMSLAIGTWSAGGRYGSIVLALFNAPVLFLMWIGHPDALPLVGVLTGFIPLALIKPQIAIWSIFANRKLIFWTAVVLLLSLVIWPFWYLNMFHATVMKDPAFGWPVTGWPIAVIGLVLLAGAGNDPWRLMAAGTLVTPYLLPYHLAILSPGIGAAKGYRKIVIWLAAWLVLLGTGLGRHFGLLNFAFPLSVYLCNHSLAGYRACLNDLVQQGRNLWKFAARKLAQEGPNPRPLP